MDALDDGLAERQAPIALAHVLYYAARLGVATPSITKEISNALVDLVPVMTSEDCRFVLMAWRSASYTPPPEHAQALLAQILKTAYNDHATLARAVQSASTVLTAAEGSAVLP